MNTFYKSVILTLIILSFMLIEITKAKQINTKKIGVLLVNHGSHSSTWRKALIDLEESVKSEILKNKNIIEIKTAFMEYNEPSIATRLKEFDKENYTDIILVPIFLTVSSHSFDDIPTIIGRKKDKHSIELLKIEKIERYTPKAKVHITPLLDFTDILQKNVVRRVIALSKNVSNEGLVLIAYGDKTYNKEWSELLTKVGESVKVNIGIEDFSYGWCGHVAHYDPDSTTAAINQILEKKDNAIVIPVLVAHDEMFQIKIIGDGIKKIKNSSERIIYKPDAILPDENIQKWVIEITNEFAKKIETKIVSKEN
ncbi:MAG: cobalamin biosynthesis protein CbiX [Ignavibacteriae bacterium]|nr:cobalamin biosynthesis protein CbiX [Ignavibacteriota bacterium]